MTNTGEFLAIQLSFFLHFLLIFCFIASTNTGKLLVIYHEASAAKYTILKSTEPPTFYYKLVYLCILIFVVKTRDMQ